MASRQKLRSEQTKQAILTAAELLFANRGYSGVSMREIAKEANCSHTTIYIYFKDKEELLHAMSMPSLLEVQGTMDVIMNQTSLSPEARLKAISMEFIHFCLLHKSIYQVVFIVKGERVDEEEPLLKINTIRNTLFKSLGKTLQDLFSIQPDPEQLLMFSRIYFFMLNGIINTYLFTDESLPNIMNRLSPTFEEAFDTLITGFILKMTGKG